MAVDLRFQARAREYASLDDQYLLHIRAAPTKLLVSHSRPNLRASITFTTRGGGITVHPCPDKLVKYSNSFLRLKWRCALNSSCHSRSHIVLHNG